MQRCMFLVRSFVLSAQLIRLSMLAHRSWLSPSTTLAPRRWSVPARRFIFDANHDGSCRWHGSSRSTTGAAAPRPGARAGRSDEGAFELWFQMFSPSVPIHTMRLHAARPPRMPRPGATRPFSSVPGLSRRHAHADFRRAEAWMTPDRPAVARTVTQLAIPADTNGPTTRCSTSSRRAGQQPSPTKPAQMMAEAHHAVDQRHRAGDTTADASTIPIWKAAEPVVW